MNILYAGMVDLDGSQADKIHFVSLARALHARGHTLAILAHGRQIPAELVGMEVHLIAKDHRPIVSRPWNDTQVLARLSHLKHGASFDVLYQRGVPGANGWARLVGLPAIVEVNGIHVDELHARGIGGMRLRAFALRERLTIQGAARAICVTDGLCTQVVRRYGVRPDHCVAIENGTDTHLFQPRVQRGCQAQVGLSDQAFHIGFVGAFQPWIDFDSVLKATQHLLENGVPVELTLVGDGPRAAEVSQRIHDLGMSWAVRLVGRTPHALVPVWLNAFDVCLSPSSGVYVQTIGKSSMKLFEYLACGRPVVASALPGESAIVAASHAGLLYQPGDETALAAHLTRLYHDPKLRDQMGAKGRAYVVQHHSWERVAEQTEAVMQAAIASVRT